MACNRPDPNCPECGGAGEIYTHSSDCRERFCALAGGMYDCAGEVVECDCVLSHSDHAYDDGDPS